MDRTSADRQLARVFLQEAEERMAAIEEALVALEGRHDDPEPLQEIFRAVHTLKGSAAMIGYDSVSDYAHLMEDALSVLRSGQVTVTPMHVTLLLQSVDALRAMVAAESEGRMTRIRVADKALVARLLPAALQTPALRDALAGTEGGADGDALPRPGRATARARSLRVDMDRLDGMLTLSGEIAVAKGRLLQLLGARSGADDTELSAAEELDRLLTQLHERVMQLRLVPIGPTFRQHLRVVRDIAAAQGKLVELELEGEDVEVDASIIEQLRDPLTHMVRNAVDHGIEHAATRHAAGKNPSGRIALRARHDMGTVVIEVADDGGGLDRDRILATARARGLVGEAESLTDAEVHRLVMLPGFSTSAAVSAISGRGVGMDVVCRNVESLRGTIDLASRPGAGTTVTVRLPLTVAIVDGFIVAVGPEHYVVPLDAVTECLSLPPDSGARPTGVMSVRGDAIPFVRIRDLFRVPGTRPDRESVVLVHAGGRRVGLVVDRLLGESQVVLKPLDDLFRGVAGISGSTILGDGRVSLILDVLHLLRHVNESQRSTAAA